MSEYTTEKLNDGHILTGQGIRPWWHDGVSDVLYPEFIPVTDAIRRVFYWEPVRLPLYVVGTDGFEEVPGQIAVGRSDTRQVLGIHSDSYPADARSSYSHWLVESPAKLVGEGVGLVTVGTLGNGEVGFASLSAGDTLVTKDGFPYGPVIMAATSLNGMLVNTLKEAMNVPVCDNTLRLGLNNGGAVYRVKHTSGMKFNLADAKAAFNLLEAMAEDAGKMLNTLGAVTVTTRQWDEILDGLVPVPEGSARSVTMAKNKRETITNIYQGDPRVAPWTGTALGCLQAFNTFAQHIITPKGGGDDKASVRFDRNIVNALNGTTDREDGKVLAVIGAVTGLVLAAAN